MNWTARSLVFLIPSLALTAGAVSVQLDAAGNALRLEQSGAPRIEGGEVVVELSLEWGNLTNRPGIGLYEFDGFIVPEQGGCELEAVEDFEEGQDSVAKEGPDHVAWQSAGANESDGLRLTLRGPAGVTAHLKLGDWHGVFTIDEGGLVERSLRRSTVAWTPEGPVSEVEMGANRANAWLDKNEDGLIKIRWGNLDDLPRVPYETFDGYAEITNGQGRLELTYLHGWESEGIREKGEADRIVEEGEQRIRWEASTVGDGDGVNVKVVPERGDITVRVSVGGFQNLFTVEGGGDYNRASAWLADDGRTIKLRWGNLDGFDNAPYGEFDGSAEIVSGSGTLQVSYMHGLEKGGDYAAGDDDRILENGPETVRWQASVNGDSDGIDVKVSPSSDSVEIKIILGDTEKTLEITQD